MSAGRAGAGTETAAVDTGAERDVIAQHLEEVSSGRPLVDTRLDSKMKRLCAVLPRTASAIKALADLAEDGATDRP